MLETQDSKKKAARPIKSGQVAVPHAICTLGYVVLA
jgi:hypothetical protein